MKKIPSTIVRRHPVTARTKPLVERWPQGWESLRSDAILQGFEPWVPPHSRLFADWRSPGFAQSATAWSGQGAQPTRYVYLGRDARVTAADLQNLNDQFSLIILDASHALAAGFKTGTDAAPASLVVVNAADAFVDYLARETWIEEWLAAPGEFISAQAQVSPRARLEPGVIVGPGSVIEADVVLSAGVRIGRDVRIGRGTRVGAYSVIQDFTEIGEDTRIGPHAAIGTPGFGLLKYPKDRAVRERMHLAGVVIGDRVRLGAYVSIDRGVFEDTTVGSDTQVDNHVQIAHNCHLGDANVLCAFVGLAGSTDMGSRSTIAGFVGTKGHVSVGSDVLIAAQSGISRDIRDGEQVKGYPALPLKDALKVATLTAKLPEFYARLKALEAKAKEDA